MSSLSSLIVGRDIASMRQVQEALALQVVYGGDLATNLLDILGPGAEDSLTRALADHLNLRACSAGPLPVPEGELAEALPHQLMRDAHWVPLKLEDGLLELAVASKISAARCEELEREHGVKIKQWAATDVRIQQCLEQAFGLEPKRRILRLIAHLDGTEPPPRALTVAPPKGPSAAPQPEVRAAAASPTDADPGATSKAAEGPAPVPPSSDSSENQAAPLTEAATPVAVAAADGAQSPPASLTTPLPVPTSQRAAPSGGPPSRRSAPPRTLSSAALSAQPASSPPLPRPPASTSEPASSAKPSLGEKPPPARGTGPVSVPTDVVIRQEGPDSGEGLALFLPKHNALSKAPKKRRRGPLTRAGAQTELEQAAHPREALSIFFDFAKQFFQYAALFKIRKGRANVMAAFGAGASASDLEGFSFDLEEDGVLHRAAQRGSHLWARLSSTAADQDLAERLERTPGGEALILPVVLRDRPLALLYADDGAEAVELSQVGEVISFASLVGQALETSLLRKKQREKGGGLMRARGAAALRKATLPGIAVPAPGSAPRPPSPAGPQALAGLFHPEKVRLAKQASADESDPGEEPDVDSGPIPAPERRPSAPPIPREEPEEDTGPKTIAAPATAEEAFARASAGESVPPVAQQLRAHSPDALTVAAPPAPNTLRSSSIPPPPANPSDPLPGPAEYGSEPEIEVGEAAHDDAMVAAVLAELSGDAPVTESIAEPGDSSPPSRVSSHPPVRPPNAHKARNLPSIIVDTGQEHKEVLDRLMRSDAPIEEVLGELFRLGESAVPSLLENLPGPLNVDPEDIIAGRVRPANAGRLFMALSALRRTSLPFLIVHSAHVKRSARLFSTFLLGEFPYPEASSALLPRIFDKDDDIRKVAVGAGRLHAYVRPSLTPLRQGLERTASSRYETPVRRDIALRALERLRLPASVPALIKLLARRSASAHHELIHKALVRLTATDQGFDVEAWADWWTRHSQTHRNEWLIEALLGAHPRIAARAARELSRVAPYTKLENFATLSAGEKLALVGDVKVWWRDAGAAMDQARYEEDHASSGFRS